jgi:hypothetical protein
MVLGKMDPPFKNREACQGKLAKYRSYRPYRTYVFNDWPSGQPEGKIALML